MAKTSNQRTVTITKTNRAGVTMTQKIHQLKWDGGRKPKGLGNAFERAGWSIVTEKPSSPPKEVKALKEVEV